MPPSTTTDGSDARDLQRLLRSSGWPNGRAEFYQPVAAAHLPQCHVIRRCDDRLSLMVSCLRDRGIVPGSGRTYLDVGSCYGWFVAAMTGLGYDGGGIEIAPSLAAIGPPAYALDPRRIAVGDCSDVLTSANSADIVSCLSLAHHIVMERGIHEAERLVARLASRTREVLFFETAGAHEAWFAHSLAGWTPAFIERWLLDHTQFDRVVALGTDGDSRGPYAGNYGRTLFACVRNAAGAMVGSGPADVAGG